MPKSNRQKLIESGIKKIAMKVIAEGKFGMFDIQDMREFGQKYKKFIDGAVRSNKNLGQYVGYVFENGKLAIVLTDGIVKFDINTGKPISSTKIWK